jgi:glycosyltransferase involved in cell wall biosynthesis
MVEAMYCGTVPWLAPGTAGTEIAQGFPTWKTPDSCCALFEDWIRKNPEEQQAEKRRARALAAQYDWRIVAPLYARALQLACP